MSKPMILINWKPENRKEHVETVNGCEKFLDVFRDSDVGDAEDIAISLMEADRKNGHIGRVSLDAITNSKGEAVGATMTYHRIK